MDKETFVELYVQSGGFREDGERLWKKGDLERRGPALANENERLRRLLARVLAVDDDHGPGEYYRLSPALAAEIRAALAAPAAGEQNATPTE